MVSAGMSIIPEMMEKIDLDGTTKYFKTTKTDIVNRMTKIGRASCRERV